MSTLNVVRPTINSKGEVYTLQIVQAYKDGTSFNLSKQLNFKTFTTGELAATVAAQMELAIDFFNSGNKRHIKANYPLQFRILTASGDKTLIDTDNANELLRGQLKIQKNRETGMFDRPLFEERLFNAIQYSRIVATKQQPISARVKALDTKLVELPKKEKTEKVEE